MYKTNLIGLGLAVGSSAFIGSSFIIKKKGLQRAGASGSRATSEVHLPAREFDADIGTITGIIFVDTEFANEGSGGYGYLLEPLWWIGMATMIIGEFANFVAYMYAPAVLVTPLGALSIIVSAVLAHFLLKEKLRKLGILGCVLCVVGSTIIVLHAPGEHSISSVDEIWDLAIQPASAAAVVLVLVLYCEPRYGQTNIMVYIGVCSIIGSLTVMSIKAIGIAIKLTLEGYSQDWSGQKASNIISVLCGFMTVLSGTMVLHSTRDPEKQSSTDYSPLPPQISWLVHANGEIWKQRDNDDYPEYVAIIHQDHFK
ncbi:hypothetical protein DH2020_035141 [Rehmannia glutinosa]|uniref:Probable magnesium transporter n=1 Tax=Rehmannia glutinosa TaxID=99300 RepID=A0ABR0VAP9_REHGL